MTAFKGVGYQPETMAKFRERYSKPTYFDWDVHMFAVPRGMSVVYILGFEGVVKVGQTVDFETRLSAQVSKMNAAGHKWLCGWLLGTDDAITDEATLIRIALDMDGWQLGRATEWFEGIDVYELIARAEAELVGSLQSTG